MPIFPILFGVLLPISIVLAIALIKVSNAKNKTEEYFRNAMFESWFREINLACKQFALLHNKLMPELKREGYSDFRRITISNPSSPKVHGTLVATVNFEGYDDDIAGRCLGYGMLVAKDNAKRYPIDGKVFSPSTFIEDGIYKYFLDAPEEALSVVVR